jgi:hypothetical protein
VAEPLTDPASNPLTPVDISALATTRARHPEAIAEAAARRTRRPLLGDSGRLMIVAADHPARGALGVGNRKLAMANRADLLERLCLALSRPGVDGVLATADILDDLLLLGALAGKVVMGSMNRGGLAGAVFEMDDRFTGHRAQDIARLRFDAGKLLLRINYDDPGSLTTLESTARAVDEMAARQLPLFVEPFISRRVDGRVRSELSAEAVTRSIAIASGLGGTSAYTWLKLPVTDDPDDMARCWRRRRCPPCCWAARSAAPARNRTVRTSAGARRCGCRPCRAWSWAGRCSTRLRAVWRPPWTRRWDCCEPNQPGALW